MFLERVLGFVFSEDYNIFLGLVWLLLIIIVKGYSNGGEMERICKKGKVLIIN